VIRLVLASGNPGKLREISKLLEGIAVELLPLSAFPEAEIAPESGATFLDNAIQKAAWVYRSTGVPAIADDSGLCVDALDGGPGVLSARYAGYAGDDANNEKLLEALCGLPDDERSAHFHCTVALVGPAGHPAFAPALPEGSRLLAHHADLPEGAVAFVAEGKVFGRIAHGLDGEGGFGYDPLFVYTPEGRTFGVLPAELKNRVSHRAQAFQRLADLLRRVP
jgi:XTP/dITP diphosphohydrolase